MHLKASYILQLVVVDIQHSLLQITVIHGCTYALLPNCTLSLTAPLDAMLRSLVVGAHGKYGNQATIDEAKARCVATIHW